jgi:ArsR family transcriptional regulator, arsenate/arsenite/antimonite-responsive transcriptional repressor
MSMQRSYPHIDGCQYANEDVTMTTRSASDTCCAPVGSSRFDERDAVELARGFHALADPVRLHLLSMIAATSDEGACVCDLVEPSGRSQPTVSHHLKILREAGLVESEKRGQWAWYRVRPDRLDALKVALG